ncbi:MAG: hypothetical protein KF883_00055 [Thermomicrobiales bacterium]|nr:hypothetical protein [Thermomicrobiales bacterium]
MLIAIIAPSLAVFGTESVGTIIILGLFLIGGVASYIEAMQIGAAYSHESRIFLVTQFCRYVFIPSWTLYLVIALLGYLLHSGLPGHFADDPSMSSTPELTRTVSKIVAGCLVVLAAYLVCWGVQGFTIRLQRFLVVAALAPAVLPMMKLSAVVAGKGDAISTEPGTGFATLYAVVLLIVPLIAYVFSAPEHHAHARASTIAYVPSLGWAPLAIGRSLSGKSGDEQLRCVPFSTPEELLDHMVGRKSRGVPTRLPGSARVRHRLVKALRWHHDFDAIVIDLRSAIRLFDAFEQQGRLTSQNGGYRIVAGICRREDVVIRRHLSDGQAAPAYAIWSDSPYVPRNEILEREILASLRHFDPALKGVDYLPPNCILERLHPGAIAVIAEPFASALLERGEVSGDIDRLDVKTLGDASWLYEHYDVLIVRSDEGGNEASQFLDMLIAGRNWLRTKPGPTGIGGVFARQIAAELEGVKVADLDAGERTYLGPGAINVCLVLTNYQDGSVIDPDDERAGSNWQEVRSVYGHLQDAGLVSALSLEHLAKLIDCRFIQQQTAVNGQSATYPLQMNRYLTNDTPGKVRDMIDALHIDDIDLSFLLAQRISGAGGVGLVYMLPTHEADNRRIHRAAHRHEWIAAGRTGIVAIRIPNEPRSLRQMLDVVHRDETLSIDTLAAFPGSDGRAIALMSFGDITEAHLTRLLSDLREHGFDIATDPAQWSNA